MMISINGNTVLYSSAKSWFHIDDYDFKKKSLSLWTHGVSIFLASEKKKSSMVKKEVGGKERWPKNAHPTLAFFGLEFTLV